MSIQKSKKLFSLAQKFLVGGVNSPVRAFKSVGGEPLFIRRGKGPFIWDADGNRYVDFVGSWGPLIFGHAHPKVLAAVKMTMQSGLTFGAPMELEIELAQLVCEMVPSIEKVRFVSSGTEAVMTAIRLARGTTGRDKIIKLTGCYHGHSDSLLVKAGSGVATLGIPDSVGVPKSFAENTISLPYNDLESVEQCFKNFGDAIAAVIVEPVAGNMGVVLPRHDFLNGLREVTKRFNALLIFDEVISGFRLGPSGAQGLYNIQPDLTCLGKIIGGGFPVGALGGKKEIMEKLAPEGPVYQAGTLSGNPVAMSAGIATLNLLKKTKPWKTLQKRTENLVHRIQNACDQNDFPVRINHLGSLFTIFFTREPVTDYDSAKRSDAQHYARFFHSLLEKGIYFPPSQFEAAFVSAVHDERILEKSGDLIVDSIKNLF